MSCVPTISTLDSGPEGPCRLGSRSAWTRPRDPALAAHRGPPSHAARPPSLRGAPGPRAARGPPQSSGARSEARLREGPLLAQTGDLDLERVDPLPRLVEVRLERSDPLPRHRRFATAPRRACGRTPRAARASRRSRPRRSRAPPGGARPPPARWPRVRQGERSSPRTVTRAGISAGAAGGPLSSRGSLDGREGFRVSGMKNLYSTVCLALPAPSSSARAPSPGAEAPRRPRPPGAPRRPVLTRCTTRDVLSTTRHRAKETLL